MSDKPQTLRELLKRYLEENLIDYDPKTKRKHEYVLGHLETITSATTLDDLTNANVAKMMTKLLEDGLERNSINGYRSKICALWRWAHTEGWTVKGPSVRKLTVPERTPVAWSPDEVRAIWIGLDTLSGWIGGLPEPLWWRVYHGIMFDTGERHDARMQLQWSHFSNIAAGEGEFPAGIRKGKRKPLPFQLSPATIADLIALRMLGAEPYVLPWPFIPNHFTFKYRRVLQHCGVPHDRYHMTHCGRRFFGTQLWIRDKDTATEGLGHTSSQITKDCYVDPRFVPRTWPHQMMPNLRPDSTDPPRAA